MKRLEQTKIHCGMNQIFPDPDEFPDEIIANLVNEFEIRDSEKIKQLTEDLKDLPFEVETYRNRGLLPDKTNAIRKLETLVNQCNKVLEILEAENVTGETKIDPGHITPINAQILWEFARDINSRNRTQAIDNGEAHLLFQEHSRAIANLRSKSQRVITALKFEKSSGRGGDRNKGDRALNDAIKMLLVYYADATGNEIGTSYESVTAEASGPLVKFMQPCLKAVGWELSTNAIRSRIRNLPPDEASSIG
jgi:hypothetical protein